MKLRTLKTITSHPLTTNSKISALVRFFKRGLVMRMVPYAIAYPFIGKTRLLIEKGMSSAELQLFTGLYDLQEMSFLIHCLQENDLFVDVGANVGVYTVLASGHNKAMTIAFEPVPSTYQHLLNNLKLNGIEEKVRALNMGVGIEAGVLKMTKNLNSALNHIAHEQDPASELIDVPVNSLDSVLAEENPFILKVDVEGYETKVMGGAGHTLKKSSLKAIIIELNGLSTKFGFDDSLIHQNLVDHGFQPYNYLPFQRSFELLTSWGKSNTIYIRDIDSFKSKVAQAPKFRVLDYEI